MKETRQSSAPINKQLKKFEWVLYILEMKVSCSLHFFKFIFVISRTEFVVKGKSKCK